MKMTYLIQTMSLSALLMTSCTSTETGSTDHVTTTNLETKKPKKEAIPTLSELEQNADIIWLGEAEVDYALNYNRWDYDKEDPERLLMENLGFKSRNSFKILKYQVTDLNASHNDDHDLFEKVLKNRREMTFYKDATLKDKYASKEVERLIGRVDTIFTFDPKTMKEQQQVVVNALDPETVRAFRLRQVIYYSQKEMTFKSIALAIAPLAYEKTSNTPASPADLKPLFWMKPEALTAVPDLSSSTVTWAKRMYRNFDLSTVKMIKQEQDISVVIEMMMKGFRENAATTKLGYTFDADGTEYLKAEEIKHLGASIDTIITFDPKTFKETNQVVKSKMNGSDIKNLRLLQDWVWNDKTKSLSIRYVGFAPIINRVDAMGNFLNSGPMFVRKVEDI